MLWRKKCISAAAERLDGATVFTVNLAEILTKVVDVGGDPRAVTAQLAAAGVAYTEITVDDAQLAAVLRVLDGARQLSLGTAAASQLHSGSLTRRC